MENKIDPKSLNIFITEKCNLNCRYCFVKKEFSDLKLNLSSLRKAIDILFSFPGERKTVAFTGGEPLLEYNALVKTYLYAKKLAQTKNIYLDVATMTNGTLLSKKICQFLENNQIIVKVSIDGNQKTHDLNRPFKNSQKKSSFKAIIKGHQYFSPKYSKLCASLVFTPETVSKLLENIKFLQKQNFSYIEIYPDMYAFWENYQLIKLKEVFKQFTSYYISLFLKNQKKLIFKNSLLDSVLNQDEIVGTTDIRCRKIHLAPNGKFYFCDKVFSLPEKERVKYIIGDVFKGIDEKRRILLLEYFHEKAYKLMKNQCFACPYQKFCFCPIGHSLYFSYQKHNFKKALQNFCEIAKIFWENFLIIKEKLKYHPLFVNLYQN